LMEKVVSAGCNGNSKVRDLADELIERNLAMMRVLPKGTTAR
jgi:hypothetical protein